MPVSGNNKKTYYLPKIVGFFIVSQLALCYHFLYPGFEDYNMN